MNESQVLKPTADELKAILDAHAKWLRGESGGKRADLQRAYLRGADLRGADLRGADLQRAYLQGADLRGADLQGTLNVSPLALAQTRIVPDGDLIVWKKCHGNVIVKLKIPEAAQRSNASGRKCRAEFAEVLEVIGGDIGIAQHDGKTEYRVGSTVRCHEWCDDRWQECAGGIHFYLTREEAEAH